MYDVYYYTSYIISRVSMKMPIEAIRQRGQIGMPYLAKPKEWSVPPKLLRVRAVQR